MVAQLKFIADWVQVCLNRHTEECLAYELLNSGLYFERQVAVPIVYKDISLECGYRIDILVEKTVIVELKSVTQIVSVHEAQIMTYLKLANLKLGLLINFNVKLLKEGIVRYRF